MSEFTIISDSREKLDYKFENHPVSVEEQKLDTGDYAVKGYEDYFAVERKTDEDFLSSISQGRDRFVREIERANTFVKPMNVIVEAPWREFKINGRTNYNDKFSDIHPNAVKGTKEKWSNYYNIDFEFVEGRPEGEERTYELLRDFYNTMSLIE